MSLDTISRGTPQYSGRYVCWLPGVSVATVLRIFVVGHGWMDLLDNPVAGDVAGWIGPLPVWSNVPAPKPAQEFDL